MTFDEKLIRILEIAEHIKNVHRLFLLLEETENAAEKSAIGDAVEGLMEFENTDWKKLKNLFFKENPK